MVEIWEVLSDGTEEPLTTLMDAQPTTRSPPPKSPPLSAGGGGTPTAGFSVPRAPPFKLLECKRSYTGPMFLPPLSIDLSSFPLVINKPSAFFGAGAGARAAASRERADVAMDAAPSPSAAGEGQSRRARESPVYDSDDESFEVDTLTRSMGGWRVKGESPAKRTRFNSPVMQGVSAPTCGAAGPSGGDGDDATPARGPRIARRSAAPDAAPDAPPPQIPPPPPTPLPTDAGPPPPPTLKVGGAKRKCRHEPPLPHVEAAFKTMRIEMRAGVHSPPAKRRVRPIGATPWAGSSLAHGGEVEAELHARTPAGGTVS